MCLFLPLQLRPVGNGTPMVNSSIGIFYIAISIFVLCCCFLEIDNYEISSFQIIFKV